MTPVLFFFFILIYTCLFGKIQPEKFKQYYKAITVHEAKVQGVSVCTGETKLNGYALW